MSWQWLRRQAMSCAGLYVCGLVLLATACGHGDRVAGSYALDGTTLEPGVLAALRAKDQRLPPLMFVEPATDDGEPERHVAESAPGEVPEDLKKVHADLAHSMANSSVSLLLRPGGSFEFRFGGYFWDVAWLRGNWVAQAERVDLTILSRRVRVWHDEVGVEYHWQSIESTPMHVTLSRRNDVLQFEIGQFVRLDGVVGDLVRMSDGRSP